MGWLAHLAKQGGHKSLRALAYAMANDESWPKSRNPASVANNLRDLDKGKNAEWWTGTGKDVLPALAAALGEHEDDLVECIQNPPTEAKPGVNLWSFQMFPALRRLDLAEESPFPGVPKELTRPGGPREPRTWWNAPRGAGKSLVGRWLEVRFGWTFVEAGRWSDVMLPQQGRVFVALTSTEGLSPRNLEALSENLKLCIAAPGPLPAMQQTTAGKASETSSSGAREEKTPSFAECSTPPPGLWVAELLNWVAQRVPSGGGFDVHRVWGWFDGDEALVSSFATPGSLLSFLGLVDEIGLNNVPENQAGLSMRWVRVWLKAAVERKQRESIMGTGDLLKEQGSKMLHAMECARLRGGYASELSLDDWASLVPEMQAPPLDRARLLHIAETAGDALQKKILAALKPDGASVVDDLCVLGALEKSSSGTFVLAPPWAASVLREEAYKTLRQNVPTGLGALLLHPETSEAALYDLLRDVSENRCERIEACVATPATTPEHMAALDAAFRAVGVALLLGVEFPIQLVRTLWDRQMACARKRYPGWPPIPMLMLEAPKHRDSVATQGAWFAAALSLSHALVDAGEVLERSSLNPWPDPSSDLASWQEFATVVHEIPSSLSVACIEDGIEAYRFLAHELGAEMLQRFGILRIHGRICELQGPDVVVALFQRESLKLEESECLELLRLDFGLAALEDACRRRGCPVDDVLTWCWQTWSTDNTHPWPPFIWGPDGGWGRGSSEDVARVWRTAPADELPERFFERDIPRKFWRWLTPAMWKRWLDTWTREKHRGSGDAQAAFEYVPEALALAAVRGGFVDDFCHEILGILWRRTPDGLLELVDELSRTAPAACDGERESDRRLLNLAYSVPEEYAPALIERAARWCCEPTAYLGVGDWLSRWLMSLVARRAPGWREAFSLLCDRAPLSAPTSDA